MKYVFDLDGTICEERPTFERSLAAPNVEIINVINDLYIKGHFIIIFTARSWAEYTMTKEWLIENKVNHNILMCGKIIYDKWIDDRAINVKNIKELL
jgi:hydroxymethylpyrimidine pyrophosphatase-like HAD family hydrolase